MTQTRGERVVDLILEADDRYGVLGRQVPVRLVNFSASGCLLQGASSLEPQSIGRLKVVFDGEQYGDDVRVARCHEVPGAGSLYSVGRHPSSVIKGLKCALACLGVCDDFMAEPFHRFRAEERGRIERQLAELSEELKALHLES